MQMLWTNMLQPYFKEAVREHRPEMLPNSEVGIFSSFAECYAVLVLYWAALRFLLTLAPP